MSDDHNADECKRFAGERETPCGWLAVGEFFTDRERAIQAAGKTPVIDVFSGDQMHRVQVRSEERQLAAEELARQLRISSEQARSAQPAPVVPVLPQRIPTHQERGINDPGWNACIDAMLSAAPAQGQQVECQECQGCERLHDELDEVTADRDGCAYQRDQLLAELSALKAQQVGQCPVYATLNGAGEVRLQTPDGSHQIFRRLHTGEVTGLDLMLVDPAPQPAPAHGVAGLVEALRAFDIAAKESKSIIGFAGKCMGLLKHARAALAAHDK